MNFLKKSFVIVFIDSIYNYFCVIIYVFILGILNLFVDYVYE